MFGHQNLKTTLKAAALAVPLIFGCTAIASAHSEGACANNVVDACNAAGGSTQAVNLCVINGLNACHTHSHGGGGGGADSASNDKKADTGNSEGRASGFKLKTKKRQLRFSR